MTIPLMTLLVAIGALGVAVWAVFKIEEVHIVLNSRLSQLLEAVGDAREAEGVRKELARSSAETITKGEDNVSREG